MIANLHKPEGIDETPDGALVVTEDHLRGRVVKVSKTSAVVEVLASGLRYPEGLVVDCNGHVHVAESRKRFLLGKGRVLRIDGAHRISTQSHAGQ